jgi:hypothetical protein
MNSEDKVDSPEQLDAVRKLMSRLRAGEIDALAFLKSALELGLSVAVAYGVLSSTVTARTAADASQRKSDLDDAYIQRLIEGSDVGVNYDLTAPGSNVDDRTPGAKQLQWDNSSNWDNSWRNWGNNPGWGNYPPKWGNSA